MAQDQWCSICRWYHRATSDDDEDLGYCHRYPPRPVALAELRIEHCWPEVAGDDFCGEFRAKGT